MMEFSAAGISTDDFEGILAEVVEEYRVAFGDIVATRLNSSFGQLQRLWAHREHQIQEQVLATVRAIDPRTAEGVHLDRALAGLGVVREGDEYAEVLGTATGTASTSIPDDFELSVGGNSFLVVDGPYVIGSGGTVAGVRVRATVPGALDVTTLGAWSLVDTLSGFTGFNDTSQPVLGRVVETDTEFRARAEVERYRRAAGPLNAIDAAVSQVLGVDYVRTSHNITTDPVDVNGIPYLQINTVVRGGDNEAVAQAIWDSGPAGSTFYGTSVSVEVVDGPATHTISFDRVTDVAIWIRATLTTSTSEETAPDDLAAAAEALLLAYATANWGIGKDVLPHRLVGALAGLAGVDAIAVTVSLDDGVGDAYSTAKRPITIRQQARAASARIDIVEN